MLKSLTTKALLLCMTLGSMLASCGGRGDDASTPRRKAYPRVAEIDSAYVAVAEAPVHFEANASAVPAIDPSAPPDGSVWINISYTMYGATLYCTFTPADAPERLAEILDNRRERIALNAGGNTTELIDISSPSGFASTVAVTPIGTVTPVQFLANNDRWVVTGSFYLPSAATAQPDSVAPIVTAARRDVIHAMMTLGAKENDASHAID